MDVSFIITHTNTYGPGYRCSLAGNDAPICIYIHNMYYKLYSIGCTDDGRAVYAIRTTSIRPGSFGLTFKYDLKHNNVANTHRELWAHDRTSTRMTTYVSLRCVDRR